ncbi:Alpha/beta hydrolase domain-containing protein 4 [Balamuthia mandrillaris]
MSSWFSFGGGGGGGASGSAAASSSSSTTTATVPTVPSSSSLFSRWRSLSWRPTSSALLAQAEQRMLRVVTTQMEQSLVQLSRTGHQINTIKMGRGPPLVLLHGFAAGVGFWCCNLDELAKYHTVYAIDLPGFGRSSRSSFVPTSEQEAEDYFLDSFEEWREQVQLDRFCLLGHSFGGYLSACYALKHPDQVEKLILADPWGIPKRPTTDSNDRLPWKWRMITGVLSRFSPLASIRAAGPYGPQLIERFRPDLIRKFMHLHHDGVEYEADQTTTISPSPSASKEREKEGEAADDDKMMKDVTAEEIHTAAERLTASELVGAAALASDNEEEEEEEKNADAQQKEIEKAQLQQVSGAEKVASTTQKHQQQMSVVAQYIYHSNAQVPATGEMAFQKLMQPIGWAVRPLWDRLPELRPDIPVTFLYGENSWMDPNAGAKLMYRMKHNPRNKRLWILPGCGHHIYVDNYRAFNRLVVHSTLGHSVASSSSYSTSTKRTSMEVEDEEEEEEDPLRQPFEVRCYSHEDEPQE